MNEKLATGVWSLPALSPRDVLQVGGGVAASASPLVWIEPGDGLGVSGLLPAPGGGGYLLIDGAGGQAVLSSFEVDESAVLDVLRRRHGQVAAEQVLCGAGLVALYRAICQLRAVKARRIGPGRIVTEALAARCPECSRALAIFCGLLGDMAGHAALVLGARGGVYIGGAIVPLLGTWFARSSFRRRFEARGRQRGYLQAIPTFVVTSGASPATTGVLRPFEAAGTLH